MSVAAVIGANYGDEGKGLLTDWWCAGHPGSVVVRYNGGAQAGHTVVTPDGMRHVFSTFGSGTFAGASTYLSRFFIVNPIMIQAELKELGPTYMPLTVHPWAPVTTPWDMLYNRAYERKVRHGSCGLGVWETLRRCRNPYVSTFVKDIGQPGWLHKLSDVQAYFAHCAAVHDISYSESKGFMAKRLLDDFAEACTEFLRHAIVSEKLPPHQHVLYEGAQGLMLYEYGTTPHVTAGPTGLTNVSELTKELDTGPELESIYVTRTYLTRHGNGPFSTEDPQMTYPDETNAPNEWQGALRFGHLELQGLWYRITQDSALMGLKPSLAVTHMDQRTWPALHGDFPFDKLHALYLCEGPTREAVRRSGLYQPAYRVA